MSSAAGITPAGLPIAAARPALSSEAIIGRLEVVARRRGHFSANPAHAQEYVRVLEQTARYYSFVITDWSPLRLVRSADAVLDHTDRLILCCGTADWFLEAAHQLRAIRQTGRARLAREAVVVATDIDGPSGRRHPAALAQRLRIDPVQVVHVPVDHRVAIARLGAEPAARGHHERLPGTVRTGPGAR